MLSLDARYKFAEGEQKSLVLSTTPITIVTAESLLAKVKKAIREDAIGVIVGVVIGWLASYLRDPP